MFWFLPLEFLDIGPPGSVIFFYFSLPSSVLHLLFCCVETSSTSSFERSCSADTVILSSHFYLHSCSPMFLCVLLLFQDARFSLMSVRLFRKCNTVNTLRFKFYRYQNESTVRSPSHPIPKPAATITFLEATSATRLLTVASTVCVIFLLFPTSKLNTGF